MSSPNESEDSPKENTPSPLALAKEYLDFGRSEADNWRKQFETSVRTLSIFAGLATLVVGIVASVASVVTYKSAADLREDLGKQYEGEMIKLRTQLSLLQQAETDRIQKHLEQVLQERLNNYLNQPNIQDIVQQTVAKTSEETIMRAVKQRVDTLSKPITKQLQVAMLPALLRNGSRAAYDTARQLLAGTDLAPEEVEVIKRSLRDLEVGRFNLDVLAPRPGPGFADNQAAFKALVNETENLDTRARALASVVNSPQEAFTREQWRKILGATISVAVAYPELTLAAAYCRPINQIVTLARKAGYAVQDASKTPNCLDSEAAANWLSDLR